MKHQKFYLLGLLISILLLLGNPDALDAQGPTPVVLKDALVTTTTRVSQHVVTVNAEPARTLITGLDDRLAQIAEAHRAGDSAKLATFAGERFIDLANKRARVIIEMTTNPGIVTTGRPTLESVRLPNGKTLNVHHAPAITLRADLAQGITATGATIETALQNSIQVSVPFASLTALAQLPGVRAVRLPYPMQQHALPPLSPPQHPRAVGTRTTEGVNLIGANGWHTAGYNGSGVSLAIFDFGFTGWATRQANGDLPAGGQLVLKDFSAAYSFSPDTAGYEHGTTCAEIAYDVAPGATIYLYAFSTDVEFGNAVNDYINNVGGLRVASLSIGWVNAGPYDGTGSINTIINNAQAAGILFAVSAGNHQKQHWSGTATQYGTSDSLAFGTGNVQGIGPTSGSLWNIPSGTQLRLFLEWNDWNAARTGNQNRIDYDLYLYRWTGATWTLVTSSTNRQCNSTSVVPTEMINYTVPSGGPYNYGLVIVRYTTGACPNNFGHWMQLYTFNGFYQSGVGMANSFWYVNQCNSLGIPADSDGAIAVGATFWNEDATSPLYGLETFSSLGPRNAPGGGNPGATVNKVDLVAPDGVSTATYGASTGTNYANGGSGFWGTSAAAPHVAGLAAVSWSGRPDYSLAQQVAYLKSQAVYKADGGACGGTNPNNRYGAGRTNLGTPPLPGLWDGGGADNNWTTAANWDDGRVPSVTTPIWFNTTSSKNAAVNGNLTAFSINLDTGYTGVLNLGGNLTVTQNITLTSGTLDVSPSNYNITLGGNWVKHAGTFNPRAGTVTFNGPTAQTIGGSTSTTFNNLTINNSAGVTLTRNVVVNGTVVLQAGDLNAGTGTNQLELGTGATVTSPGGGDIIGDVVRTNLTTGSNLVFNNPATFVHFVSLTGTAPQLTINLAKTAPSGLSGAVSRVYNISLTNATAFTATLQLRYASSEVPSGSTETNLKLVRFDAANHRWVLQGGTQNHGDGINRYVALNNVTLFSPWGIGYQGSPTRVVLSTFHADVERSPHTAWMIPGVVLGILSVAGLGIVLRKK